MFCPEHAAGCPACSSIADNLNANLPPRGVRRDLAVSTVGPDFHRDLGFLHTEEELTPFLEGETPPVVEQNARSCRTDVARYVAEAPGLSAYIQSDAPSSGPT